MALLKQWRDMAYSETADKGSLQKLWTDYFQKEKEMYAELLKNPDEVVVSREGALNSTMFFTKGKRNISVYDTGIIPFEICIFTKSIDNQLLEKGYIEIVYYVELKGASVQQNSLRMEIKKND
jgi:uncharacterized beta-barrel protein YwiB (DUF1934 family)